MDLLTVTARDLNAACTHIWSRKTSLHFFSALSIHPSMRVLTFYLRLCQLTWKWGAEWYAQWFVLVGTCEGRAVVCQSVPRLHACECVCAPLPIAAVWIPNKTDHSHVTRAWRLSCSFPQINLKAHINNYIAHIKICLFPAILPKVIQTAQTKNTLLEILGKKW